MKQICRKCNKEKFYDDFHKDCTKSIGYRNICKLCYKEYTSLPEIREKRINYHKKYDLKNQKRKKEYRDINKEKANLRSRKHQLKSKYNLTINEYNDLYNKQKGQCLICYIKLEKLVVDHCHKTNKIRGLLCHQCNVGIGLLKDNIDILKQAINYLK